jgi:predicted phosphodiesterase
MRTAVLSDIHGNLEAFQAALTDLETQHIDRIISLGDFIDYGADSEEIVKEHRQLNITAIQGNHEHCLLHPDSRKMLTNVAAQSLKITAQQLSKRSLDYIGKLPTVFIIDNMRFVHGIPPDSVREYIIHLHPDLITYLFEMYSERLCFVGHTHELGLFEYFHNDVRFFPLFNRENKLKPKRRYIINAGSVGQPRGWNKNSVYIIYDDEIDSLILRYIEYDIEKTVRKILELGYPKINAIRLL